MTKYRKLPVEIEAFQLTAERWKDHSDWPKWLTEACIRTLEGNHIVSIGDWTIRGVKGELYPCKPDLFSMTYEVAE